MSNIEIKPGYKKTKLGWIPEDWNYDILSNCGEISSGGTPSTENKNNWEGKINWYTPTEVTKLNGCGYIGSSERKITQEGLNSCTARLLPVNAIIVCTRATIGIAAILTQPGCTNQGFKNIITDDKTSYHKFLFYYIISQKAKMLSLACGSTFLEISATDFRKFPIPLPPLPEQKKIAEILSTWDEAIDKLNSLIEKKKLLKKGLMQQLLTGKKRFLEFVISEKYKKTNLGWIPEDWEFNTMSYIVPKDQKFGIVDGPFGSNLKTIHYKLSGIPIITSGFVTECTFRADTYLYVDNEKFEQEIRSSVKGGDIVMAKIGARCGSCAIVPSDHSIGILSGNALKITVDENRYSSQYVWNVLIRLYKTGRFEMLKSIGAQPAISMESLKKFKIPLPPLPEQKKIAEILSNIDLQIENLKLKIDKYKRQKKGLMQQLLTGKTRVNL